MTTETFPISSLYIHDLNPRQTHDPAEIEAKALSIASVGLAQNLAGYRDPARPNEIGIVGGGYRLLALQSLANGDHPAQADHLPALFDAVPVLVTDDEVKAEAWAMATQHQAELTPVEEIRAYGRMEKFGAYDASIIARAYGVTEARVRRRLKLAHLPDPVLDALAAREITLDTAQVMTTCTDEARLLDVLDACRGENVGSHWVKARLHPDTVRATDKRARFVGPELYEAEGGTVVRSLFDDEVLFSDEALLEKIYNRKLEEVAAEIEDEGWAFVWICTKEWSFHDDPRMGKVQQVYPDPVELPEADQAELDELRMLSDPNEDQWERLRALEARTQGSLTDDQIADLGILIWVDRAGEIVRHEGLREMKKATSDSATSGGTAAPAPEPELSQAVKSDLAAIATRTRQHALIDKTELVLDLLAFQLTTLPEWSQIFALSTSSPNAKPEQEDGLADLPRLSSDNKRLDYSDDYATAFAAFQAKGKKHRNTVLTEALARLAQNGETINHRLPALLTAAATPDPRHVWSPTPAFFARLKGGMLERIADELLHDAAAERLAALKAMKVKDKAHELGSLFENAELREAWGLSRDQAARLDAWIPDELAALLAIEDAADAREEAA